HLQTIGLLKAPEIDEHRKKLIEQKKAEYEARAKQTDAFADTHFPEGAQLCAKCSTAAVVLMDGCMTCLNCGDSKCGCEGFSPETCSLVGDTISCDLEPISCDFGPHKLRLVL